MRARRAQKAPWAQATVRASDRTAHGDLAGVRTQKVLAECDLTARCRGGWPPAPALRPPLGIPKAPGKVRRKTSAMSGGTRLQFATYPQSPDSGPLCCCDVMNPCRAFSQQSGPGRLRISLSAAPQKGEILPLHRCEHTSNWYGAAPLALRNVVPYSNFDAGAGPETTTL